MEFEHISKLMDGWLESEKAENALFKHKNGHLIINIGSPYAIDLSIIKTKSDLLERVHHLTEKEWMNSDHLRRFIEIACHLKGWDVYGEKKTERKDGV